MSLPHKCPLFPGVLMALMLARLVDAFQRSVSPWSSEKCSLSSFSSFPNRWKNSFSQIRTLSIFLESFVAAVSHYLWQLTGLWITRKVSHMEIDKAGKAVYARLLSSFQPHPLLESQQQQHSHLQRRGHQSKRKKKT